MPDSTIAALPLIDLLATDDLLLVDDVSADDYKAVTVNALTTAIAAALPAPTGGGGGSGTFVGVTELAIWVPGPPPTLQTIPAGPTILITGLSVGPFATIIGHHYKVSISVDSVMPQLPQDILTGMAFLEAHLNDTVTLGFKVGVNTPTSVPLKLELMALFLAEDIGPYTVTAYAGGQYGVTIDISPGRNFLLVEDIG